MWNKIFGKGRSLDKVDKLEYMATTPLPKYYTLLLANCDKGTNSSVINLVRIDPELDIYDYLTNMYLDYRSNGKMGNFDAFFERLNSIAKKNKFMKTDNIGYNKVYEWIKDNCSDDDFDEVIVEEVKLVSVKADKYKPNHKPEPLVPKVKVSKPVAKASK